MRTLTCFLLLGVVNFAGAQEPEPKLDQVKPTPRPEVLERVWQNKASLESVLKAKVSLNVVDKPLKEVAQQFADQLGLPVRVDELQLERVGLSGEFPVTFRAERWHAYTALKWALHDLNLTFIPDGDGLLITDGDLPKQQRITHYYPIPDLLGEPVDFKPIEDVIKSIITPEQWIGEKQAEMWQIEDGLLISHSVEGHLLVQRLLESLRAMRDATNDPFDTMPLLVTVYPKEEAETALTLHSVGAGLDVDEVPFEEVIADLSKVSLLPFHIDKRALDDVGLAADFPISVRTPPIPVDELLDMILLRHELDWFIDGQVVVITSGDEREAESLIRAYPARDLFWHGLYSADPDIRLAALDYLREVEGIPPPPKTTGFGGFVDPKREVDYRGLRDALMHSIEAESWLESRQGEGRICHFPMGAECLIVAQTHTVHRKLEVALEEIRQQRKLPDRDEVLRKVQQREDENIFQSHYFSAILGPGKTIPLDAAQDIADKIRQSVAPESWGNEDTFIKAEESGLVVRNQRHVQRKVEAYLKKVGLQDPDRQLRTPGGFF
ncbi:hypothetical protein [Bremerella cremea]|uniref:hypothetical protein n=1 Tax=Bremerella cremea TaxID=1031537 RepID=UPI0031E74E3D